MIPSVTFSSDLIIMFTGAAISALFTYVPKLNVWFASFDAETKKLSMLVMMTLVTVLIFTLGCFDVIQIEKFTCDRNTGWYFAYTLLLATFSNQGTDRVLPKPLAVRLVLEEKRKLNLVS